MEEELISVIVSVYNVEKYLPACVNSLVGQTYRTLEIILVDDGSTDGSGRICDEYAKKDSRIQVVHQENAGLSMARNSGLGRATGMYVIFVDGDDWLSIVTCRILYQGLKRYQAQCAVGRTVHVTDDDGRLTFEKMKKCVVRCDDSLEAMKHVLLEGSSMCNRLFERKLFETVHFPKGKTNEDEPTALRTYHQCKKVVFLDKYTYFYRKRPHSITTSTFSLRNLDFYYNTQENLTFIEKTAPELTPYAQRRMIHALLYCYIKMRLKHGKSPEEKQKTAWLVHEIRQHRKMALANPYCSTWEKLGMVFLPVL